MREELQASGREEVSQAPLRGRGRPSHSCHLSVVALFLVCVCVATTWFLHGYFPGFNLRGPLCSLALLQRDWEPRLAGQLQPGHSLEYP